MEEAGEQFEDVITHRLISSIDGDEMPMKHLEEGEASSEGEGDHNDDVGKNPATATGGADDLRERKLPATNFAKVEKSLASLGFFTPSSRRLRTGKVKRMTFTREVDGKKVEVSAEIVPSAVSGLPITADQDKYLALQELISEQMQGEGKVTNPIRFKSADLLRALKKSTKAGKHYREVAEWLDVMTSTTIKSQGVVWSAGQKRFVTDRFHVFDRSVSFGKELEDGSIADANYIYLSSWQLDNINQKYLLPIDLESYRELKNHIAKALVPLLQIWLFASHKAGASSFEKRYAELCEILDITQHHAPSLISRQLKPSLDELVQYGYLERWRIEKTSDRREFKAVLFHGPKFHRDRRKRIEQKKRELREPIIVAESQSADDPAPPELGHLMPPSAPTRRRGEPAVDSSGQRGGEPAEKAATKWQPEPVEMEPEVPINQKILAALMAHGITEQAARDLLRDLKPDQNVLDQLEWGEHQVRTNPGKFANPAGFYIHLIRENAPVPMDFETSRKRAARQEEERRRAIDEHRKEKYAAYRDGEVERYIAEHQDELRTLQEVRTAELAGQYGALAPNIIDGLARIDARRQLADKVPMLSFDDFIRVERALLGDLSSSSSISNERRPADTSSETARPNSPPVDAISAEEYLNPNELPRQDTELGL